MRLNPSPLPSSAYEFALGLLEVAEGRADVGLSRIHAAFETIGANRLRLLNALWTFAYAYHLTGDKQRSDLYGAQLKTNLASGADGVKEQFELFMEEFNASKDAMQLG